MGECHQAKGQWSLTALFGFIRFRELHIIAVMYRRYWAKIVALAGVIGFLVATAPPAWGQPPDEGSTTPSTTLALTDLGADSTLSFYGLQDTRQLTLPVPPGLTPAALAATVELPVNNPRAGTITVAQGDRTIARVELPATDQAPIVLPLAGAKIVNN